MEKLINDLKGADTTSISKNKSPEDLDLKVFYTKDDFVEIEIPSYDAPWKIGIRIENEEQLDHFLKNSSDSGVEFALIQRDLVNDLSELPAGIEWKVLGGKTNHQKQDLEFGDHIFQHHDPIGDLMRSGSWNTSEKDDFTELNEFLKIKSSGLTISGQIIGEAGGSAIMELATTTAYLNEYLNRSENTEDIQQAMISISIGNDFFLEIAKIRALKLLIGNVLHAHSIKPTVSIIGENNRMNLSSVDGDSNIIRATTICMSGIIGGCTGVVLSPHLLEEEKFSPFANRIARNIQLMMRHEAYLNRVADPASGSYFLEALTHDLANKSWSRFQEIEKSGGFLSHFKSGELKKKLADDVDMRIKNLKEENDILVSINKYRLSDGETSTRKVEIQSSSEFQPILPVFLEEHC